MALGFLTLWLDGTIIIAIAIVTRALAVPKWCLLLNPIVAAIVLLTVKKCGGKIVGVLGVGFLLFSVLLIIAGV